METFKIIHWWWCQHQSDIELFLFSLPWLITMTSITKQKLLCTVHQDPQEIIINASKSGWIGPRRQLQRQGRCSGGDNVANSLAEEMQSEGLSPMPGLWLEGPTALQQHTDFWDLSDWREGKEGREGRLRTEGTRVLSAPGFQQSLLLDL